MDELTRKALVDQCENIIADLEERELDSTDWEGLNHEELKCISECLQFGQLKGHLSVAIERLKKQEVNGMVAMEYVEIMLHEFR